MREVVVVVVVVGRWMQGIQYFPKQQSIPFLDSVSFLNTSVNNNDEY